MQPPNDLPRGYGESDASPSRSNGFAISQRHVPKHPTDADRIITALGTHNVHGRTFSYFTGTSATKVLNGNPLRVGFTIQNVGADTVYVGIGTQPTEVSGNYLGGIWVLPGGFYEPQNNYVAINDIFVVSATADVQINVIELVKQL